jgi:predicted TIM-barrel fold metal-dependent hydrolase
MSNAIFDQPKIDCHCHILDPQAFPYRADTSYRPAGQETGSADYFKQLLATYGVKHALLVGPNSGYGLDNRCMLDAIANSAGVFKGIAVVTNDAPVAQLQELRAQGVVGVAFNMALHGLDHYRDIGPLLERLASQGMFAQVQFEGPQMAALAPMLLHSGADILIDHCGRPVVGLGHAEPGFQAMLRLGTSGRATVKLSGMQKFSTSDFPFADAAWVVQALLQSFGPSHCLWASDWPFLKAERRLDYGPLLRRFEQLVPDATVRHAILWDTPKKLFGF